MTLDIKSAEGRRQFEALVKTADCVVNNLRGTQPAKLGIDYASLKHLKPSIVCLHISAYGRAGERADWPGYDFLMQAEAGLMELTGDPDGAPTRVGVSLIDSMSGITGIVGLLACLLRARTTGQGCDVETCLYDVAMHQLTYPGVWYLNEGDVSPRVPRSAHLSLAPVQTFPTKDGWIFVMCMTQKFWLSLVKAMGREELLDDPRFADPNTRAVHRAALTDALDPTFRTRTTAEWLAAFNGLLPAAPVHRLDQALDSGFARDDRHGLGGAASGEGQPARHRQPHPHRRRAAGAGRLFAARRRQRLPAGQTHMKLEGLKVVDLSWFLPGPYLTTALADHGAEVIKVEPPDGDPGRHIRPPDQRTSVFFRNMGRGKKSVVLDLKSEQGRADLFRLACEADVLVEIVPARRRGALRHRLRGGEGEEPRHRLLLDLGLRPGRRLSRPRRARSRARGHDRRAVAHPGRRRPAGDPRHSRRRPGERPARPLGRADGAAAPPDHGQGRLHRCLHARGADGLVRQRGRQRLHRRHAARRQEQRTTGGSAFYRVYDTSDGRQLVLAGQEMKFIRNLLTALGKPEFIDALRMAGRAPEAGDGFPRRDLPREAAGALDEVARHARHLLRAGQHAARGDRRSQPREARCRRRSADDGRKHLAPVVRFKDEPSRPLYREPLLGEHTEEILAASATADR